MHVCYYDGCLRRKHIVPSVKSLCLQHMGAFLRAIVHFVKCLASGELGCWAILGVIVLIVLAIIVVRRIRGDD